MQRDRNGLSPRHGTYSPGSPGVGDRGSHKSPLCERYLGTWPIHGVPVLYAKGTLPSICSERVSAGLAVE